MSHHEIGDLLERLCNLLRADARSVGSTLGLQPVHLEVLGFLDQCNRYSNTPLAVTEYLGSTKGTVSQTLKRWRRRVCYAAGGMWTTGDVCISN